MDEKQNKQNLHVSSDYHQMNKIIHQWQTTFIQCKQTLWKKAHTSYIYIYMIYFSPTRKSFPPPLAHQSSDCVNSTLAVSPVLSVYLTSSRYLTRNFLFKCSRNILLLYFFISLQLLCSPVRINNKMNVGHELRDQWMDYHQHNRSVFTVPD